MSEGFKAEWRKPAQQKVWLLAFTEKALALVSVLTPPSRWGCSCPVLATSLWKTSPWWVPCSTPDQIRELTQDSAFSFYEVRFSVSSVWLTNRLPQLAQRDGIALHRFCMTDLLYSTCPCSASPTPLRCRRDQWPWSLLVANLDALFQNPHFILFLYIYPMA